MHETLDGEEVSRLVDDAMGRKCGGPRKTTTADGEEIEVELPPEGESLSDVPDTVGVPEPEPVRD